MMVSRILEFGGIEFPFVIWDCMLDSDSPLHTHDFTELTIVIDGSADHIVEGNKYTMSRGEVFMIVPPFAHGFENVNKLKYYNIMFDLEKLILVDDELKRLPGFQALFILEPSHRYHHNFTSRMVLAEEKLANVISICRIIQEKMDNQKEGYKVIIKTYLLALISYLSRHLVPEKQSISKKFYKIAE